MRLTHSLKAEISAILEEMKVKTKGLEEKLHDAVEKVMGDHKDTITVKPVAINSNAASDVVAPAQTLTVDPTEEAATETDNNSGDGSQTEKGDPDNGQQTKVEDDNKTVDEVDEK